MSPTDHDESRYVRGSAVPTLLAVAALAVLVLTSCSVPRASITASLTPSPTPQPVQVALALTQAGQVADGTLAATATVTVTNHLAEAISLVSLCGYSFRPPYLKLDLYVPPSDVSLWRNVWPGHNPFCTNQDLVTVAPGSSQSWAVPIDISKVPAEHVVHGAIYRVIAYVQWHTGLLPSDVVEAAKILHEPGAQADITLT
jgi:hypothetical protein